MWTIKVYMFYARYFENLTTFHLFLHRWEKLVSWQNCCKLFIYLKLIFLSQVSWLSGVSIIFMTVINLWNKFTCENSSWTCPFCYLLCPFPLKFVIVLNSNINASVVTQYFLGCCFHLSSFLINFSILHITLHHANISVVICVIFIADRVEFNIVTKICISYSFFQYIRYQLARCAIAKLVGGF